MTIQEFIAENGLTMRSQKLIATPPSKVTGDWQKGASHYLCVIESSKIHGQFVTEFTMGSAYTRGPKITEVLDSIALDSDAIEVTFKEFCDNYGYDRDSIKAKRIYGECRDITNRLCDFLGESAVMTLRADVERL